MRMTTQAPRADAGAAADAAPAPLPNEAPHAPDEEPPTGHPIVDAYAEAADPTGAVKDTKQVPEPDSLGG
jgi:hypothetical protein